MRSAVFLDRDGLINQKAPEHDYIRNPADLRLLPGAADAIRRLNGAGFLTLVVTNQRGVARGMMTVGDLADIHRLLREQLARQGARLDGIYVCPHESGECNCRKPDIGLFLQAEADHPIDRTGSWMVGDSPSDVEAGRRYGVRTILTSSLADAVSIILEDRI